MLYDPQLVGLYGPEASKHLFRCLVSSVDLTSDGRSYGKDGQQLQMLCQEANTLISKPNFVSILCHGFEKQENKVRTFCTYSAQVLCSIITQLCMYVLIVFRTFSIVVISVLLSCRVYKLRHSCCPSWPKYSSWEEFKRSVMLLKVLYCCMLGSE